MPREESPNAQANLNCIDARIRCRQACIRNMHVAQFDADVMLRAENVHAQCRLIHEIHRIRSRRDIVTREQNATREFQVG